MKFTKSANFLEDRLSSMESYTTLQEKEALLVSDDDPIEKIVKEITDIEPINEKEAEAILVKSREISVSNKIEYVVSCKNCGATNNFNVSTEPFFNFDIDYHYHNNLIPKGIFESPDDIINNTEADNISLREYNELDDMIAQQNETIFTKISFQMCRTCKTEIKIKIDPRDIFSKSSIKSIYRDYVNISMYSNNSKLDIDTLYPFERELFNNLIAEKMEDKQ